MKFHKLFKQYQVIKLVSCVRIKVICFLSKNQGHTARCGRIKHTPSSVNNMANLIKIVIRHSEKDCYFNQNIKSKYM